MVTLGDDPSAVVVCSTGTQTSRSCTPFLPLLLPEINEEPEPHTERPEPTQIKLPPALKLGRSLTDLGGASEGREADELSSFLYSDRFSRLFASARALKREKRRSKLTGSLPNLGDMSLKVALQGVPVPVAKIKEGGSVSRGPRRQHTIADLNNMRNKFTQNRYPTSDNIILNGHSDKENRRRNSPVSVGSQTTARTVQTNTPGRVGDINGSEHGLEGLLRSDSIKTLDNGRNSRNYNFQRSKTSVGEKESKAISTTFITASEDSAIETTKRSIYKLDDSENQLNNTPRDGVMPIRSVPILLSPGGDSDRMRTPELAKYVNNQDSEPGNFPADQRNKNGYPRPVKAVRLVDDYRKSKRQTPKMVLKYYGSELAMKSGVIPPNALPDNSAHIRGILSTTNNSVVALGDGTGKKSARKVLFKERRNRRQHDLDKRLAATSIVLSADNVIFKPEKEAALSLTTKNLAIFDEFQHNTIKPLHNHHKTHHHKTAAAGIESAGTGRTENNETRVLQWVKARQASQNKVPKIIPLKYSKTDISVSSATAGKPGDVIAETDEPKVMKALPAPGT